MAQAKEAVGERSRARKPAVRYGNPEVGSRLQEFRRIAGLKQEQIAGELETTRQVVSQWETGVRKLTLENARRLCEQHPELSLDWLMLGKGPRPVDNVSQRIDALQREIDEMKRQSQADSIPAAWVDDFLNEMNRPEVVKEVASIFTSVRADERGRTLKPHEIDEVIADAVPRILDRFREYVVRRKKQQ